MELTGDDLKALCGMFELPVGISRSGRIARLLDMGRNSYPRLVQLSRLISLGNCVEDHVSARTIKDVLSITFGLSSSGSKHEMLINAVTSDKFPAAQMLAVIDAGGIRKIYKQLLGKHPIEPEPELKKEVLRWLDFKAYVEPVEAASPKTYPGLYLPPIPLHVDEPISKPSASLSLDSPDTAHEASTQYDVAISYAGEDETAAKEIAEAMKDTGLKVFFAPYEQAHLWGKKLSDAFKEAYGSKARYVLVLISKHYALKDFTNFEFTIARDEARKRREEFILPVRLDQTPIIGLHSDVGYIDYGKVGAKEVARLMKEKVTARTPIIPILSHTKLLWPSLTKKN